MEKYDITIRAASTRDVTGLHEIGKQDEDVQNEEQCRGHHAFSSIWRPTIGKQLSGRSAMAMMHTLWQ